MSASKTELVKILTAAGVEKEKAKGIAEAIAVANKKADDGTISGRSTAGLTDDQFIRRLQKQSLGMDRILNQYDRILNSSALYREELERFTMAGYDRSFNDFSESIEGAIKKSLDLTGNIRAAETALAGLKTGFKGFGLMTEVFRNR